MSNALAASAPAAYPASSRKCLATAHEATKTAGEPEEEARKKRLKTKDSIFFLSFFLFLCLKIRVTEKAEGSEDRDLLSTG